MYLYTKNTFNRGFSCKKKKSVYHGHINKRFQSENHL